MNAWIDRAYDMLEEFRGFRSNPWAERALEIIFEGDV